MALTAVKHPILAGGQFPTDFICLKRQANQSILTLRENVLNQELTVINHILGNIFLTHTKAWLLPDL